MIKEYEKWVIPNQYSNIPAGCCTYRDGSSIFVFYDSGELDYCDMLKGDSHIWYGGKQWVIQTDDKSEILASHLYCKTIDSLTHRTVSGSYYAMRRSTMNKVFSTLNTSPMANKVIEMIKGFLDAEGYDDYFFDHVERNRREYLIDARSRCSRYRRELKTWRESKPRSVSLESLLGER